MLGKKIGSEDDVVVGIAIRGRTAEKGQAPAEVGKRVADFRLKNYDQREYDVGQNAANNPVQRGEFANAREVEKHSQYREAYQHGYGAGAADHHQHLVDQQRDQEDVERNPCALAPGCYNRQHSSLAPGGYWEFHCNAGNPAARLHLFLGQSGLDLPGGQAGRDLLANADCVGVFQKLALRVEDQSITAIEYGEGRKRLEDGIEPIRPHPVLLKHVAGHGGERCGFAIEFFAHPGEDETQIVMADAGGYSFPAAAHLFKEQALGELHSVGKVIEFLLALANNFHDAGKGAVLGEFGQGLTSHQQAVTHGAAKSTTSELQSH